MLWICRTTLGCSGYDTYKVKHYEGRHFASSIARWVGNWQTLTQEWFRMWCCHITKTSLRIFGGIIPVVGASLRIYWLNGPRDVDFGLSHVFTLDELWVVIWLGRLEMFVWPTRVGGWSCSGRHKIAHTGSPFTHLTCSLANATRAPHVAGLFTDGVIGIFHSLNPSGCSVIPGSTQPERVAGVSSGA
jgi:hypothetical protein